MCAITKLARAILEFAKENHRLYGEGYSTFVRINCTEALQSRRKEVGTLFGGEVHIVVELLLPENFQLLSEL